MLPFGCGSDKGAGPEPNRAPMLVEMRDTSAVVGDTLNVAVQATDPDGDELHYELIYECTWSEILQDHCPHAGIRTVGVLFWFCPRAYDISLRRFTIVVSDDRGGSDTTAFAVAVSEP